MLNQVRFQTNARERDLIRAAAQANADQIQATFVAFFGTSGVVRIEREVGRPRDDDSIIGRYYPITRSQA